MEGTLSCEVSAQEERRCGEVKAGAVVLRRCMRLHIVRHGLIKQDRMVTSLSIRRWSLNISDTLAKA